METLIKNIEVVEAKLRILSGTLKAIHKFQKDSHKLSSIIAGDDGVDAAQKAVGGFQSTSSLGDNVRTNVQRLKTLCADINLSLYNLTEYKSQGIEKLSYDDLKHCVFLNEAIDKELWNLDASIEAFKKMEDFIKNILEEHE